MKLTIKIHQNPSMLVVRQETLHNGESLSAVRFGSVWPARSSDSSTNWRCTRAPLLRPRICPLSFSWSTKAAERGRSVGSKLRDWITGSPRAVGWRSRMNETRGNRGYCTAWWPSSGRPCAGKCAHPWMKGCTRSAPSIVTIASPESLPAGRAPPGESYGWCGHHKMSRFSNDYKRAT